MNKNIVQCFEEKFPEHEHNKDEFEETCMYLPIFSFNNNEKF